jgi:thioredoxin reductase
MSRLTKVAIIGGGLAGLAAGGLLSRRRCQLAVTPS